MKYTFPSFEEERNLMKHLDEIENFIHSKWHWGRIERGETLTEACSFVKALRRIITETARETIRMLKDEFSYTDKEDYIFRQEN